MGTSLGQFGSVLGRFGTSLNAMLGRSFDVLFFLRFGPSERLAPLLTFLTSSAVGRIPHRSLDDGFYSLLKHRDQHCGASQGEPATWALGIL